MSRDDRRPEMSWEPTSKLPPETPWGLAVGLASLVILMAIFTVLFLSCAHAMDHGFDHNDATVQWFESLMRPYMPGSSCCGKADAYAVQIDREPIGEEGDLVGIARVTDGAAITYPDGTKRTEIPNGTEFKFPLSHLNPPKDGNPTSTAWAFLGSYNGKISVVYCVIPLPPGS
jgi:hypothetical protein